MAATHVLIVEAMLGSHVLFFFVPAYCLWLFCCPWVLLQFWYSDVNFHYSYQWAPIFLTNPWRSRHLYDTNRPKLLYKVHLAGGKCSHASIRNGSGRTKRKGKWRMTGTVPPNQQLQNCALSLQLLCETVVTVVTFPQPPSPPPPLKRRCFFFPILIWPSRSE